MSSQLTTFVPLFNGSNWQGWAKQMHAYLIAQGQGSIVQGTVLEPVIPAAPAALAGGAYVAEINIFNNTAHARE